MVKYRYLRYSIQGKGTKSEKKIKLKKPIKVYYCRGLKQWVTIPDD